MTGRSTSGLTDQRTAPDNQDMEPTWRRLPRTTLGKVRLAAMLTACVGTIPELFQVSSDHPAARRAAGTVAIVLLLVDFVVTFARRRATLLDPLLVGVAVFLGGISLRDPMAVIGLCIYAVATQSLYGSHRAALVRLVALLVAFPATIAVSPISLGRYIPWRSGAVLGLLPGIAMMCVLMRALYVLLVRHEGARGRETLLAGTGSRLLNRTDVQAVRTIIAEAATALCAQIPATGVLILRRDGESLVVERSAGFREAIHGALLEAGCLEAGGPPHGEIAQRAVRDAAPLDQVVGERRHWRAVGLATAGADRLLLVSGTRPVPDETFGAFWTLATQWSLAEANCDAHMELAHQVHHDQLTALPNRTLFFPRLAAAVDSAGGQRERLALLIIDLDDFKQVNDVYGHAAGDELLVQVGNRLVGVGGGSGVPARFGGDEFALLLTDLRGAEEADEIAERLRQRLLDPFQLSKVTVSVGASIGVAGATPGLTAGDLMRCADIAMYAAKAKGKNRVERFTGAEHGDIAQLRLLEEHLTHAVERDEIVLHYQPQIDLRTGCCSGVEALVRWRHPTLGFLGPSTFIPLAERTGQIVMLGDHVLDAACRQVAAWTWLSQASELRVAVNVAARQLAGPGFADTVRATLRDSGLPAHRLTIEITESELIDKDVVQTQIQAIAEMGVRIAIDDFGTGYASLASLRSFPIHQLKIDRSFLTQVGDDTNADALLQLVVSVGRILDLETVAEGVETRAQAVMLHHADVSLAQGYLFARPMPAQEFLDWLLDRARVAPSAPQG